MIRSRRPSHTAALAGTLLLLAACGSRTDLPNTNRTTDSPTAPTASGASGAGGNTGPTGDGPCTACIRQYGPTKCKPEYKLCGCPRLAECMVNAGCFDDPYQVSCGFEACDLTVASPNLDPYAHCATCLDECRPVCRTYPGWLKCEPPPPVPACVHDICEPGVGLEPGCDPCVKHVCYAEPKCCEWGAPNAWGTNGCIDAAKKYCERCGG